MIGLGTLVNVLAVLMGGLIGLFFHGGLKERFQNILLKSLGLSIMFIGISGALENMLKINENSLEASGIMLLVISLVTGSLLGEWINIEKRMEDFGEWLKMKVTAKSGSTFVEGFVTSSLVICVGAMAIIGSLQDGLYGDATLLFTKSILDFVFILISASTLGLGVVFSAIPLGLYQGLITVFAQYIQPLLTDKIISDLSLVGSVLIFAIGVNQVFGQKFKVGNMLPAIVIAVICSVLNI
ncbi:MAG: DUF554 domain-containing protein [Clostridia bacterium]|jgi:uncharacterized membrane protein YqgA involved in biofilm formation|nr:DUF554 domain-containing protein [Clostridia bacterium]